MAVEINGAQSLGVAQAGYGRTCVRTSGGGLYVVGVDRVADPNAVAIWYSATGAVWAEKDAANRPVEESGVGGLLRGVAMAIDSNDLLHIILKQDITDHNEWSYTTFDTTTDQWNGGNPAVIEEIDGGDGIDIVVGQQVSIAIDSNDVPHVVYVDDTARHGTDYNTIYYNNRIGGAWNANSEEIEGATTTQKECTFPEIDINDNDRPVIVYLNDTDDAITAQRGQANDPLGWDVRDVDASVLSGATNCPSIATDSNGDVWVAYVDDDNTIDIAKQSANWTDPWTVASDGDDGESPSLAINGTDVYVFYEGTNNDIWYNRYAGAAWLGEVQLEIGTMENVHARYANLNLAAYNTYGIDYVWADAVNDYWWNRLVIAVAVRRIFITHV